MTTLRAFHGDPKLKAKCRLRLSTVGQLLGFVPGDPERGGVAITQGAPVGKNYLYESLLGIPNQLAALEERLFDMMPTNRPETSYWPERFVEPIAVGSDLSAIWPAWAVWMLTDQTYGVVNLADAATNLVAWKAAALWSTGGTPAQFSGVEEEALRAHLATLSVVDCALQDALGSMALIPEAMDRIPEAMASSHAAWAVLCTTKAAQERRNTWAGEAALASHEAFTAARSPREKKWVVAAADKLIDLLRAAPPG